jgi:hypothetical protein
MPRLVTPAQAGVRSIRNSRIPAFAGMTECGLDYSKIDKK